MSWNTLYNFSNMAKKIILILLLFALHQHDGYAGGCPFLSKYKINQGNWSQSYRSFDITYTIYINQLDTVHAYVEDCDGGPFFPLEYQLFYNGLPISEAKNDFKTDSSGTYTIKRTGGISSVTFIIIDAPSCPEINAGPDQELCNTSHSVSLNATRNYFCNTIWSGGTGRFSPDAKTPGATYILSSADTAAGSVKLYLSVQGNCSSVRDSINIILSRPSSVNAGPDQTLCGTELVTLNGSIGGGASEGIWNTLGSGTFSPANTDLNATYIPSEGDISGGSITLELVTGGVCGSVTDDLLITLSGCLNSSTKKSISAENIKIYPNPNNGNISIDFSEEKGIIRIDILNVFGERLKTIQVDNTISKTNCSIEDLNGGVYFVGLMNDQGRQLVKKIIKK
jgi:hypothetical protein